MDYRYLKAFRSAARHLSFVKAAQELKISPSAVTRQIALLEESVGGELFVRGNKKVILSEMGARLDLHLAQFDSQAVLLRAESLLRIGCLQSVFEFFLIEVMQKNPKVFNGAVDIEIDSPGSLMKKIESGRLDLVISNQLPAGNSALTGFKLFQEEIGWKGRGKRTIIFSAFENHYSENRRHSPGRIRINSFHGAYSLVKQGFGEALFAFPEKKTLAKSVKVRQALATNSRDRESAGRQWIYAIAPNYSRPPEHIRLLLEILRKGI